MAVPSGTVTFLFTDIEGSTRQWELVAESMSAALARHDAILRSAIDAHCGYVFSTGGDGFSAAFERAGEAVAAALEAQAGLAAESWPAGAPIRVRMGLHTGEADERAGNYFGPALNRCARLMAAGHGGQILCSSVTAEMVAGVALLDLGEHRLPDLSAPLRVYQVGQDRFPLVRSIDARATNLPVPLTALIGRDAEIAELGALLGDNRLVTLTGTGGVGKTRLAVTVAGRAGAAFPDGCWLVELGAVAAPAEVTRAVASAVGAPIAELNGLARYLGERRMLIVLDNCEHLLDATASLVEKVLAAGPDPVVVATTRVLLGVAGEAVYRVRSLAVPEPDVGATEAERSAAVRLFVERAAAGAGRFVLDDSNAGAVAEICRRLDGIPLAIEMAAARLRAMSAAEIAARLGERFRWSARPGDQQRTLQATVDWSHGLLVDSEQVAFRRLAVFPATFDLAAADAVAGGDGADVVEDVVRLVDCSLVQYDADESRYRLLETLRQYAEDRLREAGETDETRERHARYFLALAQRLGPETEDARYENALPILTAELDNLRLAIEWCVETQRRAELARTLIAVHRFVFAIVPAEAASWYRTIVDHESEVGPRLTADVLGELAWLTDVQLGDRSTGSALARRSIDLSDRHGLVASPFAYVTLAEAAMYEEDHARMLPATEQALIAAEARDDGVAASVALGYQAMAYSVVGDAAASTRAHEESLDRAERTGHRDAIQSAVVIGATRHLWSTSPDFLASLAALERYDRGYHYEDSTGVFLEIMWGATLVGLHRRGATEHLARAMRLADRLGVPNAQDLSLRFLAIAAARAGYRGEAATLVGYSDAHLHTYERTAPMLAWVQAEIDEALAGMPDRVHHETSGAAAQRGQIAAVVRYLDSVIDRNSDAPAS